MKICPECGTVLSDNRPAAGYGGFRRCHLDGKTCFSTCCSILYCEKIRERAKAEKKPEPETTNKPRIVAV